jgi:hypothetical protein
MDYNNLEKAFARAFSYSLSKMKLTLGAVALFVWGMLVVFCKGLSFAAQEWGGLNLSLLPFFLFFAIFLPVSIGLIRLHYHDAKGNFLSWKHLIETSFELFLSLSYLALFPLVAYFAIWVVLGIFFLLKEIPIVGDFFGVLFVFAPFLLIAASFALFLFNLLLLFFIPPMIALKPLTKHQILKKLVGVWTLKPFTAFLLFMIAIIPVSLIGWGLSIAASWTHLAFAVGKTSLVHAIQWFLIMIPFGALLTPFVVFFFNFSAEAMQLLQGRVEE